MMPLVDTTIPGAATTLVTIGPAAAALGMALLAGLIWIGRGVAEELRRQGARRWEANPRAPLGVPTPRLAA